MRIIGGKWRRRVIAQSPPATTRPMPDRVKETVFDVLGSYFSCPGRLPPLLVADVFAGTGSMGLEALSRGATACCFYEHDRRTLAVLRRNIESVGGWGQSTIIARDAWTQALRSPDERQFDLVLLDPPYIHSEDVSRSGQVKQYLGRLAEAIDNKPVVVLHHPARAAFTCGDDEAWHVLDRRRIGTNAITMFTR